MKKNIISFLLVFFSFPVPMVFADSLNTKWTNTIIDSKFDDSKQSFCVTDKNGALLDFKNKDLSVIPASVSKVYVSDFAIHELGVGFRYKTQFVISGNTLYINGTQDPFFVSEQLESILNRIQKENKKNVIKKVVLHNFTFNWSEDSISSQILLQRFLYQQKRLPLSTKVTTSNKKYTGKGSIYEFSSKPLPELLKQMNIYSTNTAAEALLNRSGGLDKFKKYMLSEYGAGPEIISFQTGSGLEGNKTTCTLTLKVMKHLGEMLYKNNFTYKDILPVPVVDGGSMKNRMKNIVDTKVLLVKPGFIYNHETLAGVLHTSTGNVYFAIFTEYADTKDVHTARVFIDSFTKDLIDEYKAIPFRYETQLLSPTKSTSIRKL